MDFAIGLPRSKELFGVEYDSIPVIVDRLTKMVYYKRVLTTLDADQRAEELIEAIIKYHGLPDYIVTDRKSLFTSTFWSSFCYYLNINRRLSTVFHPKSDGQPHSQNSTIEANLQAYYRFERDN